MFQKSLFWDSRIVATILMFISFDEPVLTLNIFFSVLVGPSEEKLIMESWCLPIRYLQSQVIFSFCAMNL